MSFVEMKLVTTFGGFEKVFETKRLGGGVRRRRGRGLRGCGGGGGGRGGGVIDHDGVD